MTIITCPNCLVGVETDVKPPVAVLCNGRGEHIFSKEPMGREERKELLIVMNARGL